MVLLEVGVINFPSAGCDVASFQKLFLHFLGLSSAITFKLIFEFLSLGVVFLGVKNNSKNFGNKKI